MSGRPRRVAWRRPGAIAVLVLLSLLLSPSSAWAQRVFTFGRWQAVFEFGFDRDSQATGRDDTTIATLGRNLLTERLRLRSSGFVLGRRLFTFTPNVTLGFTQDSLVTGGEGGLTTGKLLAYDLSAGIFPDKPYGLRLIANKSNSIMPLRGGGTSEIDSLNRGATFSLPGRLLHSTFSYWERRVEATSTGFEARGTDEFRKTFDYNGTGGWRTHNWTFRYQNEDIDNRVFPELSYPSKRADAYHRWDFGENARSSVSSSVQRFTRDGVFREEYNDLDERVMLQHTPTFSTRYAYRARWRRTADRRSRTQTGTFSLQHQLYESLSTGLDLHGGVDENSDGGGDGLGGRLTLNYRKRLPGGARLTSDLLLNYEQESSHSDTGAGVVQDERHAALLGAPIRLEEPNPVLETVVVTDSSRAIVYAPGLDYTLTMVGSFGELTVLDAGSILESQALLVSYSFAVARAVRFQTRGTRFGVTVDRGFLSGWYTYLGTRRDTLAGDDEGLLFGQVVHQIGARMSWNGPRLQVALTHRFQSQDSPVLAFRTIHFNQSIRYVLNSHYLLAGSAEQDFSSFEVPERQTRSVGGRVSLRWEVVPGLKVDGLANARIWRDTLGIDDTFLEAGARLEWRLPKLDVHASVTRQFRWRGPNGFNGMKIAARAARRF